MVCTLLCVLAASAALHVVLASAGAKNWLLLASRMWLQGARLDVDFVEINPPLIIWLYALPVRASLALPALADYAALGLMGLVCAALTVGLSTALLRFHPQCAEPRMCVLFALALACIFVFLTSPAVFFDRDHILLMLTFPYMLRFMPSLARQSLPWTLRLATGALAALGFCIKPHGALIFAVLQLLYLLRERKAAILWSIENIIIFCAATVYLFCVWHFVPEYVHAIFPMALKTYSAYSREGSALLYLPLAFFSAGLTFAEFRLRHATPYRRDILYFTGIAAAFLIYALISNGWEYTYHPLFSLLQFLSVLVFVEYRWLQASHEAQGLPSKSFFFGARGCVMSLGVQALYMAAGLVGAFFAAIYVQNNCKGYMECRESQPYVQYVEEHKAKSFGTMTLDFPKWTSLARMTNAHWETRFNHLWMLPGLVQEGAPKKAKYPWILDYVANAYAQDLDSRRPDIVFVDAGYQYYVPSGELDLPGYFAQVPAFALSWSHYRREATLDECTPSPAPYARSACRYDVYRRTDSP